MQRGLGGGNVRACHPGQRQHEKREVVVRLFQQHAVARLVGIHGKQRVGQALQDIVRVLPYVAPLGAARHEAGQLHVTECAAGLGDLRAVGAAGVGGVVDESELVAVCPYRRAFREGTHLWSVSSSMAE